MGASELSLFLVHIIQEGSVTTELWRSGTEETLPPESVCSTSELLHMPGWYACPAQGICLLRPKRRHTHEAGS